MHSVRHRPTKPVLRTPTTNIRARSQRQFWNSCSHRREWSTGLCRPCYGAWTVTGAGPGCLRSRPSNSSRPASQAGRRANLRELPITRPRSCRSRPSARPRRRPRSARRPARALGVDVSSQVRIPSAPRTRQINPPAWYPITTAMTSATAGSSQFQRSVTKMIAPVTATPAAAPASADVSSSTLDVCADDECTGQHHYCGDGADNQHRQPVHFWDARHQASGRSHRDPDVESEQPACVDQGGDVGGIRVRGRAFRSVG